MARAAPSPSAACGSQKLRAWLALHSALSEQMQAVAGAVETIKGAMSGVRWVGRLRALDCCLQGHTSRPPQAAPRQLQSSRAPAPRPPPPARAATAPPLTHFHPFSSWQAQGQTVPGVLQKPLEEVGVRGAGATSGRLAPTQVPTPHLGCSCTLAPSALLPPQPSHPSHRHPPICQSTRACRSRPSTSACARAASTPTRPPRRLCARWVGVLSTAALRERVPIG